MRNGSKSLEAVLIAGPTASGKSALAVNLAKKHGGPVINADSMQVYSVLQHLSARPLPEDMQGIEHWLFGHVHPSEPYSVATWLDEAGQMIERCRQTKRVPVFAGGTGLYFKSMLEGLSAIPPIDPDIRRSLRDASQGDIAGLFRELQMLDPLSAAKLEAGDTQRIVRALEVVKSTGKSIAYWQSQPTGAPLLNTDQCLKIVLSPPRKLLHERIAVRFASMVEDGAVEEVRQMLSLALDREMPAMRAIGVSQLGQHLEGKISLETAVELSVIATRQYAKRQTTWFRHQFDDNWRHVADAKNL